LTEENTLLYAWVGKTRDARMPVVVLAENILNTQSTTEISTFLSSYASEVNMLTSGQRPIGDSITIDFRLVVHHQLRFMRRFDSLNKNYQRICDVEQFNLSL